MLNLMTLKDKQKKESTGANRTTAAYLRLQKGSALQPLALLLNLTELNLPKNITIRFPDGSDKILNFEIVIVPDDGFHRGGRFVFSFKIPHGYPHDPPKVKCLTKVFHPNIDLEGNVCLNILREDWRPVMSINLIIHGLSFLFQSPNTEDPLNKEAAEMMERSDRHFETQVQRSIHSGAHIQGEYFPPCSK